MERRGFLKAIGAALAAVPFVRSEPVEAKEYAELEPVCDESTGDNMMRYKLRYSDEPDESVDLGPIPYIHSNSTPSGTVKVPAYRSYMKEKWLPKEDAPDYFGVDRSPYLGRAAIDAEYDAKVAKAMTGTQCKVCSVDRPESELGWDVEYSYVRKTYCLHCPTCLAENKEKEKQWMEEIRGKQKED